jgi:hypothetical protein
LINSIITPHCIWPIGLELLSKPLMLFVQDDVNRQLQSSTSIDEEMIQMFSLHLAFVVDCWSNYQFGFRFLKWWPQIRRWDIWILKNEHVHMFNLFCYVDSWHLKSLTTWVGNLFYLCIYDMLELPLIGMVSNVLWKMYISKTLDV